MNFISQLPVKANQQRVLLVLQENMAYWFRVAGREIADSYVELVTDDFDQHRPSWITNSSETAPVYVELLLDTTLDEVDRVSVKKTRHRLLNHYRQLTTLSRLRNDYPYASVYCLPGRYQEHVAAVRHPAHPACWDAWLSRLQTKHVIFHQACTGSELVARWSRRFAAPVFLTMQAGNYQRHLLVDCGATVFLRTIAVTGSRSGENKPCVEYTRAAVEQSMAYLGSAVVIDDEALLVVGLSGCSVMAESDAIVNNPKHVPGRDEKPDGLTSISSTSVQALVNMLLGNPVSYECTVWHAGQFQHVTAQNSEHALHKTLLSRRRAVIERFCRQWFGGLVSRRKAKLNWPLSVSALRFIDALAPSARYQKASNRITIMLTIAVALVVMATLAMSVAVVNGITGARELRTQRVQINNIRASISDVQTRSKERYAAPLNSTNALFLLDQIESSLPVDTQQLLDEIATAVTRVPALFVDHIVWVVLESDETYDSLAYALSSIGRRQSVKAGRNNEVLQLELAGRIAGESLLDRKRQLDAFVVELKAVSGAGDVHIIESPADAALSSNMQVRSQESFRLSLRKDQI